MRRLDEDKPDLILMDVVMPGQNGFQLTRAPITRDPRFADVPVIMCTSKNQETDKVWGMRQGARDYIVKAGRRRTSWSPRSAPSTDGERRPSAMANKGSPARTPDPAGRALQAARTEQAWQRLAGRGGGRAGPAVPLREAGEIFALAPHGAGAAHPPLVLGVANLRGHLHSAWSTWPASWGVQGARGRLRAGPAGRIQPVAGPELRAAGRSLRGPARGPRLTRGADDGGQPFVGAALRDAAGRSVAGTGPGRTGRRRGFLKIVG